MRANLTSSAFAFLSFSSCAFAADDVMASRFGNTTITKDAAGNEVRLYYAADHTFTVKTNGRSTTGNWELKGAAICLTYANTAMPSSGTPNPTCVPVSAHKVGDTWTAGPYSVSLVAGVQ